MHALHLAQTIMIATKVSNVERKYTAITIRRNVLLQQKCVHGPVRLTPIAPPPNVGPTQPAIVPRPQLQQGIAILPGLEPAQMEPQSNAHTIPPASLRDVSKPVPETAIKLRANA